MGQLQWEMMYNHSPLPRMDCGVTSAAQIAANAIKRSKNWNHTRNRSGNKGWHPVHRFKLLPHYGTAEMRHCQGCGEQFLNIATSFRGWYCDKCRRPVGARPVITQASIDTARRDIANLWESFNAVEELIPA